MNFKQGANAVYKNDEKLELAKVVEKYKKQYDEEVEKNHGKTRYNYRRKRHVAVKPYGVSIRKQCGSFTLT